MNTDEIVSQLNHAKAIIDECITLLSKSATPRKLSPKSTGTSITPVKLDFELNERNFIKTYAKGLGGGRKFTLLLAYMTKGKAGVDVELETIQSKWNKMKAKNLLGKFNFKYPTDAKTQGWVDSKKRSIYHLQQGWMRIFKQT